MNQINITQIKSSKVWNQNFEDCDEILDKGILKCEYIPNDNKAMLSIIRTGQIIEQIVELMLSKYNLSMAQKSVLESLYFCETHKLSQSELSKYIFSSKANVSTLLNRMEEKNLIQRENISKREKQISLTTEGKKLLEKIYLDFGSKHPTSMFKTEKDIIELNRILLEVRTKIKSCGLNKK